MRHIEPFGLGEEGMTNHGNFSEMDPQEQEMIRRPTLARNHRRRRRGRIQYQFVLLKAFDPTWKMNFSCPSMEILPLSLMDMVVRL
jgi:hypothetical protein